MIIDSIPKAVGMAYAIIATIVIIVMLRRGRFTRKKGYIFLIVSTLFGFIVFAPMLPYQFQTLIIGNAKQLGAPLPLAVSEEGAAGLPVCNPLSDESELHAFAHIDASGVLKRSSFDDQGVSIGAAGIMVALEELCQKEARS